MKSKIVRLILFAAILTCMPDSVLAQKKKAVKKSEPVVVAEPTEEEINFENLLPSTARLQIVDSVVTSVSKMYDAVPLAPGMGKLSLDRKDSIINYTYVNEVGSKRIMSIADKKGEHHLYTASKVGEGWSNPVKINIPGGVKDIICPLLMPDGTTLYFAAKNGTDNVGKHDVFYTVYDSDEDKYISPQSLGLPYNSSDEDYYAITDEFNNLGYIVTSRRQKKGNVCIYTFIPTETRETYAEDSNMSDEKLLSLAHINKISDTQRNKKAVKEAQDRLKKAIHSDTSKDAMVFSFVVRKNLVYHGLSDFKAPANKDNFTSLYQKQVKLKVDTERLAQCRNDFHKGNRSKQSEILILEGSVQKQRLDIKNLEKQIRNLEIKTLTK